MNIILNNFDSFLKTNLHDLLIHGCLSQLLSMVSEHASALFLIPNKWLVTFHFQRCNSYGQVYQKPVTTDQTYAF